MIHYCINYCFNCPDFQLKIKIKIDLYVNCKKRNEFELLIKIRFYCESILRQPSFALLVNPRYFLSVAASQDLARKLHCYLVFNPHPTGLSA